MIARLLVAAATAGMLAVPASANERGVLAPIVRASVHTVTTVQPPPRENLGDILDRWGGNANRAIYGFNAWLYDGWNALVPSAPLSQASVTLGSAAGNLLLNWINEPLTMAGYTAAGRFDHAGISGRRFLVNTFRGWGGVLDPATEIGLVVPRVDFGLALCVHGMPAGPYTVLPVVGPRTLRDGAADLVAVNALVYAALAPFGLPLGTLVFIMVADEVVHLALMRQIDAVPADEAAARDYDQVRADYLAERDARCEQLRNRATPQS